MNNDTKNFNDDISIAALGGLGEIGKNMYLIEYRNQIFIIDSGILFPDEHLLGVDYVIPDFQYLMSNQEKIVGLFITHGHEDHIGGIPFLLKKVKIPKIYASGIAVDLIENKLMEMSDVPQVMIVEYKSHFKFDFNGIEISFIRLNHSIPDSFAIVFKTGAGTIIHTGDFKFDFTPVGPSAEYEKLAKLGSEGVLCLLSDSTNALVEGITGSEKKVGESINELFSHIDSRIIVATFASNIYRIQQILEASINNDRKVAIFGRSMEKAIEIGQQVGYIKVQKDTIIDADSMGNYPPEKITLLCTGSQGEPLAALSRVANGTHKQIKLIPGDTIVFSSSPIPGNQAGVNRTINALFKRGANVITHSPLTDTHTSGHGAQSDLKLMLSLIRPTYFMPIHGEYRMQRVHANLAIECGVKPENTFIMENGDVLTIKESGAKITNRIHAGEVYIDGIGIGDISSSIIQERRNLSDDGLFAIIVTIDKAAKTIPLEPQVVSRGFIYMKDSEELTKYFIEKAKDFIIKELHNQKTVNINEIKRQTTDFLSKTIIEKTDRKPIVIPVFMEI